MGCCYSTKGMDGAVVEKIRVYGSESQGKCTRDDVVDNGCQNHGWIVKDESRTRLGYRQSRAAQILK